MVIVVSHTRENVAASELNYSGNVVVGCNESLTLNLKKTDTVRKLQLSLRKTTFASNLFSRYTPCFLFPLHLFFIYYICFLFIYLVLRTNLEYVEYENNISTFWHSSLVLKAKCGKSTAYSYKKSQRSSC